MSQVIITRSARIDLQKTYDWWSKHRSKPEAARWFLGIHYAIQSLTDDPERFTFALEADLSESGIRQMLFGLGRRKSHRIVYAVQDQCVVILRIRHTSQDDLTHDDLV